MGEWKLNRSSMQLRMHWFLGDWMIQNYSEDDSEKRKTRKLTKSSSEEVPKTKRSMISRPPNIVTFHIQRSSYQNFTGRAMKIQTSVTFQCQLAFKSIRYEFTFIDGSGGTDFKIEREGMRGLFID